jgi:hypothetical protein
MLVSQIHWSPDCRFISVGGGAYSGSMKIVQTGSDLFEKMLSVKDLQKRD